MTQRKTDLTQEDCRTVVAANNLEVLSVLKNHHILVTGGTGFLGTWVAELVYFLNVNHQFNIRLSLLSRNANILESKAPHLASSAFISLINKDVRTLVDLPDDVSYVIHAASNPDSREHSLNPLQIIDAITNGTSNVLDKCTRLNNLRKILNLSSGLIYGRQPADMKALPETYMGSLDPAQINSLYAEAKRLSETIGTAYRTQYKLPIVTVRPFTFTGPYQGIDKPWAMNNFIRDALQKQPIRILGSGATNRSFMYGSDAAYWILAMLATGKEATCYNLGSKHGISIKVLAETVAAEFTPAPSVMSRTGNETQDHVSTFIPDTTAAEQTLGLKLTVDINASIKRTIQWHTL
jgi:dTDP-glucose 4,6-dehydratase